MTSSTLIPLINEKSDFFQSSNYSSNRYSIHDYGQGYRTYTYEFDLIDYEPEQITVLLNKHGKLSIRAYRPFCHVFRREYNLGGPGVETRLVRNTIDAHGRLRVDVDVHPRPYNNSSINNKSILTFDLEGYRPKNITVLINENGLLKITAQEVDQKIGHRINREYYRQHQLPKDINPDQIRAKIDENQILTIELPQSLSSKKQSWQPYYEKNGSTDYRKRPYENSRCCNVM